MGLRFRRSIRLGKYVRINIGKTNASVSMGVRGAHITAGKNGVRRTVGIPGSGLSYTKYDRYNKPVKATQMQTPVNNERKITVGDFCPKWLLKWFGISIVMCVLGFIGCFTQGIIILFLPVGFVCLLICLIIYFVKWSSYARKIKG